MAPATEEAQRPPDNELRMSLAGHLGELRTRLLRCTIAVLVLGGASLFFAKSIYGLLMRPVLAALPPEAATLIYTSAIEEINVYMKVGMYSGVFLTTPVLLWQIWGFVSPGLYPAEKKLAGPFVVLGTLAFLAGALFCYFVVLDQMFPFLLREERASSLERRLETAQLREQEAIRYLQLGQIAEAGKSAKAAMAQLAASASDADDSRGDMGIALKPKPQAELAAKLSALGRLLDATAEGLGSEVRPVLLQVMEQRRLSIDALSTQQLETASQHLDQAAALLAGVAPSHALDFQELWKLERALGQGAARYQALNWTRPMLAMGEQLTLVLVLELAFGVIFELPLVMALLGLVGLVRSAWLMRYQRHAFVVCLILAAIITPTGDAINLALMAGPMLLCYEIGVLAVWLIEKRRARRDASSSIVGPS